jgi:hypothetical protein
MRWVGKLTGKGSGEKKNLKAGYRDKRQGTEKETERDFTFWFPVFPLFQARKKGR